MRNIITSIPNMMHVSKCTYSLHFSVSIQCIISLVPEDDFGSRAAGQKCHGVARNQLSLLDMGEKTKSGKEVASQRGRTFCNYFDGIHSCVHCHW